MPLTPSDLQNHRCLGLTAPNFWPDWRLRRGNERATVHASGPVPFRRRGQRFVSSTRGGGIMLSAEWFCGRHLADGRLVRALPDWRMDREANAQIVLPPGRLVPAKTRVFIERVIAEFTPSAPWTRQAQSGPVGIGPGGCPSLSHQWRRTVYGTRSRKLVTGQ